MLHYIRQTHNVHSHTQTNKTCTHAYSPAPTQTLSWCSCAAEIKPAATPRPKRTPKLQERKKARALDALASLRARGGVKGARLSVLEDSDQDSRWVS